MSQGAFGFEVRFQVKDRGGGRVEHRVDGVVVGQADFRERFGLGLLASPWVAWKMEITGKSHRLDLRGLVVGVNLYPGRKPEFEIRR